MSTVAAWFIPRLYTTAGSMTPGQSNGTATAVEDLMSGFLVDVAQSTAAGLANAVKESAAAMFNETKEKLVSAAVGAAAATTSSTAAVVANAATTTPISALPSSLVDTGIGTHWLRNLLGRSEWSLPCVGVKLVL